MSGLDWNALRRDVRNVVRLLVPSPDVDDVVQEVMLALVTSSTFPISSDASAYSREVARNLCAEWHRDRFRRPRDVPLSSAPQTELAESDTCGPQQQDDLRLRLRSAVLALAASPETSDRDRTILREAFVNGMSIYKVAAAMGLQRNQVRRSIVRLTVLLRASVRNLYPPYD